MNTPLISIVVPIYGVERYLRQCVDSILAQTFKEIEIILVDDGSPDACPGIVDEYAARDPRVVAVHQPNGGYGRAVNHGISLARAPYIGIIESDDWIEPTMYEKLYQCAQQTHADLVKGMYWIYNSLAEPGKQDDLWASPVADLRQAPDDGFRLEQWDRILLHAPSIWSCLYKAEIIKAVPVIESTGAAYQDTPFFVETLSKARTLAVVKEPLVHYRRESNQGSSSTSHNDRPLRVLDMLEITHQIMLQKNLYNICKEACYFRLFTSGQWGMNLIGQDWKAEYFDRFRQILLPLAQDCQWYYFNPEEKEQAQTILQSASYTEYTDKMNRCFQNKVQTARLQYPQLKRRYRKLQFALLFSLGKHRKQLKERKKQLKQELRACRALMRHFMH